MKEPRSLYINQLINHYRKSFFDDVGAYTVNYRYETDNEPTYLRFGHNEGLDVIQKYIKDLEKKVDELQYIERIIQAARRTTYD
jgi:hypothetical protein